MMRTAGRRILIGILLVLLLPIASLRSAGASCASGASTPDALDAPKYDTVKQYFPVNKHCTVREISNGYLDVHRLYDRSPKGVPMAAGDTARFLWDDALPCAAVHWQLSMTQAPHILTLSCFDADGKLLERFERPGTMEENMERLPRGTRCIEAMVDSPATLVELALYEAGKVPSAPGHFEPPLARADLLFVVAHPDDEHAMMGGLVPYYDAERGYAVQVASVTHGDPTLEADTRRFEFRNGLAHSGLTHYPLMLGLLDNWYDTAEDALYRWNVYGFDVTRSLVRLIRSTRPDVAVTHDFQGEYGHGAHIAVANAMVEAVRLAADPSYDPDSASLDGVWQVKKLYIHLYPEHPVLLDFDAPLAAFHGETPREVAAESVAYHTSQKVSLWRETILSRVYDSAAYGLYFSTVGYAESGTDFFDNIEPRTDANGARK